MTNGRAIVLQPNGTESELQLGETQQGAAVKAFA